MLCSHMLQQLQDYFPLGRRKRSPVIQKLPLLLRQNNRVIPFQKESRKSNSKACTNLA